MKTLGAGLPYWLALGQARKQFCAQMTLRQAEPEMTSAFPAATSASFIYLLRTTSVCWYHILLLLFTVAEQKP
jgi:hypothetical protein